MSDAFKTKPNTPKLQYSNTPITRMMSKPSPVVLYREREVMALVVRGLSNKQIAAELGTKEINRQGYRARVMQKMQASSLADLVRMCDRLERFVPVVAGKRPLQKRAEAKP